VSPLGVILVLGGAPLACAALLLIAKGLPDIVGRALFEFGIIGLFFSLTALLTVAAVTGLTELAVRFQRYFGSNKR
jgi:hypothetical protein